MIIIGLLVALVNIKYSYSLDKKLNTTHTSTPTPIITSSSSLEQKAIKSVNNSQEVSTKINNNESNSDRKFNLNSPNITIDINTTENFTFSSDIISNDNISCIAININMYNNSLLNISSIANISNGSVQIISNENITILYNSTATKGIFDINASAKNIVIKAKGNNIFRTNASGSNSIYIKLE